MPSAFRIPVRTASKRYAIVCRWGIAARLGRELAGLDPYTGIFVLSSPRIWRRWGKPILKGLAPAGRPRVLLFDDRESAKRLSTVEALCRALARARADRRAILLAVGGGVVGDVAGFVAAAYLRGVRLLHVPTTLVALADSAIGGKTGVNLPEGKNLVGAFYQPDLVLADPQLLASLPGRAYRSGLYEVIKYGVIRDPQLFRFLENRLDDLLARDPRALSFVIARCVAAKAAIVSADEREAGPREVLNLGHTLGHALEAETQFRRFFHGEAVGVGILAVTLLAVALRRLAPSDGARILRLVLSVGPLPQFSDCPSARLIARMHGDKKARGEKIRWVLPRSIGKADWGVEVHDSAVASILAALPELAPGKAAR